MIKKSEPWKFPDGSQLSRTALEEMGISSGDTRRVMLAAYQNRNSEMVMSMAEKGSQILKEDASQNEEDTYHDRQEKNDERHAEEMRQTQARTDEQNRVQAKRDQENLDEKKEADAKAAAEQRPQDDAENSRIMGLPLGLAGFGLSLGFAAPVLGAVSGAMSGSVNAMNGPMMVASNNGGGLLAMARGAFGILGPDKDIRLDGPNQTSTFTPGEPEPEPAFDPDSPTPPMPGLARKPGGMAPPSPRGMA